MSMTEPHQPDWRYAVPPDPQLVAWTDEASPERLADYFSELLFGPREQALWLSFFYRSRGRLTLSWPLRRDSRKFWVGPVLNTPPACGHKRASCGPQRPHMCR